MKVAFDVDDTLIVPSVVTGNRDTPNYDTIALYKWFQSQGCYMSITILAERNGIRQRDLNELLK